MVQDARPFDEVAPFEYYDVDDFGGVKQTDSRGTPWNEKAYMDNIEYLYVHMKGEWHVSDNGIDWLPVEDQIAYEEKQKARRA